MFGFSDQIGRLVMDYYRRHGGRAPMMISDDVSRAIGRHDWEAARRLQRAKLRFERMEMAGYFDIRPDGTSPASGLVGA